MSGFLHHMRRLSSNRNGNFAMMTAIVLPVLIGGAGLAIDLGNIMLSQRQLQEATDSAALAVSTALADGKADETSGKALAKDFVGGQMSNYVNAASVTAIKGATVATITTTATGTGKSFNVAVNSSATITLTPLIGLFAGTSKTIAASSTTTSGSGTGARNGLSMEVLVDASTSMSYNTTTVKNTPCIIPLFNGCLLYGAPVYVTKIEALKQAATALFDALDKSDPSAKYVRTGAISYTTDVKGKSAMAWGTTDARKQVAGITILPASGTNATTAVNTAATAIKKNTYGTDTESVEQKKKNNSNSDRVIILMTDGEMTGESDRWDKNLDQSVRKECSDAKSAGIIIYTVAFMAPDNGKSLLKYCASSTANYYEPETMDGLVTAFASIADNATKAVSRLTN
jgi:Flp pilus assembly protein TadG